MAKKFEDSKTIRRKVLKEGDLPASLVRKLAIKRGKKLKKSEVYLVVNSISLEEPLQKSEYQITKSDKELKLEFGTEVPADLREKALSWARRKGLKIVEASLAKSEDATSYVIYSF